MRSPAIFRRFIPRHRLLCDCASAVDTNKRTSLRLCLTRRATGDRGLSTYLPPWVTRPNDRPSTRWLNNDLTTAENYVHLDDLRHEWWKALISICQYRALTNVMAISMYICGRISGRCFISFSFFACLVISIYSAHLDFGGSLSSPLEVGLPLQLEGFGGAHKRVRAEPGRQAI